MAPFPSALTALPLELQQHILSYLAITSLLAFARTSHHNARLTMTVLTTLHLAVFSKKVHGVLAFLTATDTLPSTPFTSYYNFLTAPEIDWLNLPVPIRLLETPPPITPSSTPIPAPCSTSVPPSRSPSSSSQPPPPNIRARSSHRPSLSRRSTPTQQTQSPPSPTIPETPLAHRRHQIHLQNTHLATILQSPLLQSLTTLTLHTYTLLSPTLARTITSLTHLRQLTLNFSHPAIHDPCLPSFYWESTPTVEKEGCEEAWEVLVEGTTALRTLCVRRAAVERHQLLGWVESCVGLRELRLGMVAGVDAGFVEALPALMERKLVAVSGGGALKSLSIEKCQNLKMKHEKDCEWVEGLARMGLRGLKIEGCAGVDEDVLTGMFRGREWAQMGLLLKGPALDVEDTRTRSLTSESTVEPRKSSVIEIDPRFDR